MINDKTCSPPGSSVHGILQARILEWVAMPSSRGPSRPRGRTCVSYISWIGRRVFLPLAPPGKPIYVIYDNDSMNYHQRFVFSPAGNNLCSSLFRCTIILKSKAETRRQDLCRKAWEPPGCSRQTLGTLWETCCTIFWC